MFVLEIENTLMLFVKRKVMLRIYTLLKFVILDVTFLRWDDFKVMFKKLFQSVLTCDHNETNQTQVINYLNITEVLFSRKTYLRDT